MIGGAEAALVLRDVALQPLGVLKQLSQRVLHDVGHARKVACQTRRPAWWTIRLNGQMTLSKMRD